MEKQVMYLLIQARFGRVDRVATKLLKYKSIQDVHELLGQWDIICKVNGKDMNEITSFLEGEILPNADIAGVETLIVSDTIS
ncbi:MAG TPA: Lrp/AsnC ligand binding domain-containing protein [Candidatus Nanoarchaeia archaeon]|nr:Lrp/AsnC ligand binding domain-containing protein [Candidatus Nanoarchaeia archaeon]